MLDTRTARQMPIRNPHPEVIRRLIAEKAAEHAARTVDHFLQLIGPVEPAHKGMDGTETAWRLAYYQGALEEHAAIERAVCHVQRAMPLMRAD